MDRAARAEQQLLKKVNEHNKAAAKNGLRTDTRLLKYNASMGISNQLIEGQFTLISEEEVLYYVSNLLVIKNVGENSSVFLSRQGRLQNVTALAASYREDREKSLLIAAGESSQATDERKSVITLIQVSKQSTEWRTLNTHQRGTISSIQLNPLKNLCACMLLHPQNNSPLLVIWKLGKDQLLVSHLFKSPDCSRFTLDPHNQRHVYTLTQNCLKLWEVNHQERSLRQVAVVQREHRDNRFVHWTWLGLGDVAALLLVSHTKLEVVVGTEVKGMLGLGRDELKVKKLNVLQKEIEKSLEEIYQMKQLFQDKLKENDKELLGREKDKDDRHDSRLELRCAMQRSCGRARDRQKVPLVVAANGGLLLFFQLDRSFQLHHTQSFQVCAQQQIQAISGNRSLSMICCTSRNNHTQNLHFNFVRTAMFDSEQSPVVNFFGDGSHYQRILSISCARMKDIFVSSSADRSVKVWNYGQDSQSSSLLSVQFKQQPLNASLHPLGLMVAVNFKTEIKVFSIMASQLFLIKSIKHIEDCKGVMFSHYGHFLVCNQYSTVKIYDTVSFKLVNLYEVDQNRVWITQCCLSQNDEQIVAVLNNGAVYMWDIQYGRPAKAKFPERPAHVEIYGYKNVLFDSQLRGGSKEDSGNLFVGTNERKFMVVYRDDCRELLAEFPVTDCTAESLCIAQEISVLVVGTSKGTVRLYGWPIDESACLMEVVNVQLGQVRLTPPVFTELQVHRRHVSRVEVSDDSRYVVTGGDDGSIMVLEMTGMDQRRTEKGKDQLAKAKEERKKLMGIMNNLFLMKSSDVQSKNQLIKKSQLDVLKAQQAVNKQRLKRQKDFQHARDRTRRQFQAQMLQQNRLRDQNFASQQKQIQQLQLQYQNSLAEFKQMTMKSRLEHERRKQYELERNRGIELQIEGYKLQHKKNLDGLLEQHKKEVQKVKHQFKEKNQKLRREFEEVMKEAERVGLTVNPKSITDKKDNQAEQQNYNNFDSDQDEFIISLKEDIAHLVTGNEWLKKRGEKVQAEYEDAKRQDNRLQSQFQLLFQRHNELRLKNLKNDQEIIKLQHQLLQRLQVIDFKQQACKQARQQQKNLQNFKLILDGRIGGLQQQKMTAVQAIKDKQAELEKMFNQLVEQTHKNSNFEHEISGLQGKLSVLETDIKKNELRVVFDLSRLTSYQQKLEQLLQVESRVDAANKIQEMLEKQTEQTTLEKILCKGRLSESDVKEVLKLGQEGGGGENQQLLKYGSWMAKKLNLMKITSKKVKDIKQDNINIVLKQNQRLLEECNLLRTENHVYDTEIRNAQNMIEDITRKEQAFRGLRAQQALLSQLEKKFKQNQQQLDQQHRRLDDVRVLMGQNGLL